MSAYMIFPALLSIALIGACKTKQDTAQENNPKASTGAAEQNTPVTNAGETAADSLVLSIERTPCFGACKAYRLHVYRSGYATYEGRVNVEKEGMHEARVGRDTLDAILREAERIGFFALDDVYDSPVTDLPSTIIHIALDKRDKRVLGRVGTPASFRSFAEYIEELLVPLAWKPIPPQH
jgi:hypothetical protein